MLPAIGSARPIFALSLLLAILLQTGRAWSGAYCPEYVGSFAFEVASADFNRDGFADFAVTVEPNAVAIVLGQTGDRPTRFAGAIPTGGAVYGIAAGDLNGDGSADLVVAQQTSGLIRVLLGHGDGTFAYGDPIDSGANPYRVSLADLDGDGDLDVALINGVTTAGPEELSLLLNAGGGSFAPRIAIDLSAIPADLTDLACGDIDGDGDGDVVVVRQGTVAGGIVKTFSVILSNGDGTFAPPANSVEDIATSAIALGDINHDGRADLVARDGWISVSGTNPRRLSTYFGRADGTFDAPVQAPTSVVGLFGRLRLGDLNGDGNLDAVMTGGPGFPFITGCSGSRVGTALGDGAGGFVETPAVTSGGIFSTDVAIADVNGDGKPDVATTGYECGTLVVHPGNGDGTLSTVTHPARAFVDKHNELIRLNSNKTNWCLNFEAVGGTFDLTTEGNAVRVVSVGTGTISEIGRDGNKPIILGDADNNGIPDIHVCYTKAQLRQLFSNVTGRQTVTLSLRSDVGRPGCLAEASLTIDVLAGGGNNAAAFVRSETGEHGLRLVYSAERSASAHLRVYDVSGRLVKSVDLPAAAAGWNDVRFDDRDAAGRQIPSGVFFYRLDVGGKPLQGKFVIAR